MEIVTQQGIMVGKVGRHCYAVLCLGILLVSVAIARYTIASEPNDPRERTKVAMSTEIY